MEFPDNGARAIGRAGAVAADPEDGLALVYNPAGLGSQMGLRFLLDSKLCMQGLLFKGTGQDSVTNDGGPFFAPAGVFSYGFGAVGPLQGLTVAIGAVGPSAVGRLSYPEDGAQRYGLISSDFFIAYYSLGVGADINDWLSVGLTGQLLHGTASFSQAVWSGFGRGTDPDFDTVVNIDVTSGFIPTGVFGITVRPIESLALGLSYRPKLRFTAEGDLVSQLPESPEVLAAAPKQVGKGAELLLTFPHVIRLGAEWSGIDHLAIEVDLVYEGWSAFEAIEVRPKNVVIESNVGDPTPLEDIVLQKDFNDAWSVRLGADYNLVSDRLVVRGGYLYESSAIPDKSISVDFANWGRHAVSIGASLTLFGVIVDVAYAHHFIPTKEIDHSAVMQVTTPPLADPQSLPVPEQSVVGNGYYSATLDVISLAVRVPWDDLRSEF
ncbi:MAG: hypothetical protein A2289_23695 [Deltaproteobacteria bacterium RIFOXYA12_FULL_58_15]|nr:MAG: hypothetical protein A2289_23695 [Deltaproteobacteria bacterium RIFOXYA12_FULL_58_15]